MMPLISPPCLEEGFLLLIFFSLREETISFFLSPLENLSGVIK